jgi:rhodanese-related sulfurtransferase
MIIRRIKESLTLLLTLAIGLFFLATASADNPFPSITPTDAYNMLDPENTTYNAHTYYLLDVRTPAEWLNPGHPGKSSSGVGAFLEEPFRKVINIPVSFNTNDIWTTNNNFVAEVQRRFHLDDYLIVICRSGNRSVTAANLLYAAGFTNLYNVLYGFSANPTSWMPLGLPYNQKSEGMWKPPSALEPAILLLLGD